MLTIIRTIRHPAPLPAADRATRLAALRAQTPSGLQTDASAAALAATILHIGCRCGRASLQSPTPPQNHVSDLPADRVVSHPANFLVVVPFEKVERALRARSACAERALHLSAAKLYHDRITGHPRE